MVSFTGQKHRPFEFLGEGMVRAIALTSLVFIALIFIFVFKEAVRSFIAPKAAEKVAGEPAAEFETYGEEDGALPPSDAAESVMREGVDKKLNYSELKGPVWQPVSLEPKYGLLPLIAGSAKVALVSILIAGPLAILAALFTAMFAPPWAKEVLKPAIEILAGFPSVVIGFFALTIMASFFQDIFGYTYRLNAFVGGVALSLAIIPVIYTISDDSLTAVPRSYVEASLALGASKWQTVLFVVLPAALPGIFAAVLLGIGRAVGETMIVLMATGNAAMFSASPFDSVRTMSATIGAEMAEVVFGDTHYGVLFLIGTLLFIFSFSLCFIAEVVIRDRLMRRFRGA